jgi:N-formylglutamate deformylase
VSDRAIFRRPVYLPGQEPTPDEIAQRVGIYWRPYHDALAAEIARIKAAHGRVVLWEGHSIRSVVPFLFDGRLPDFNLGTANGASCSPELQRRLVGVLEAQKKYTFVVNGRFKGGYITRRYGDPANGVDAVQLELAQSQLHGRGFVRLRRSTRRADAGGDSGVV